MSTQDAKKTGNNHSTLLDSLMKAAEKAAPQAQKSTFADSCIKIASESEPTLQETLEKMASQVTREQKMRKQAQMELDAPPISDEPDFDAMAGEEPPMEDPMEEPTEGVADLEDAKQSLADALVALCGSVDQAIECLQSGSAPDELDESPLDGAEVEEDMATDDVIPGEILDSEPEPMMKPMEAGPEMPAPAPEMQQPFPR